MKNEMIFLYELFLELLDKGHIPDKTKRDELIAHLETLRSAPVESVAQAPQVEAPTANDTETTPAEDTPTSDTK